MIAYLSGTVKFQEAQGVILLVQGVGYFISVPKRLMEQLHPGVEVELFTYQHVREDALELFGFDSRDDLAMFKQLIQVSGIGPKLGLAALSQYSTAQLQQAIINSDVAFLKSISGIGKKTAERMIIDLKESVTAMPMVSAAPTAGGRVSPSALEALQALGYSVSEAAEALQGVDSTLPVEEQIKAALKQSARF